LSKLPAPSPSAARAQPPIPPKDGFGRAKGTGKVSKPRGSRRKAAKVVEEPEKEDIAATVAVNGEMGEPVRSRSPPPRPPAQKPAVAE